MIHTPQMAQTALIFRSLLIRSAPWLPEQLAVLTMAVVLLALLRRSR